MTKILVIEDEASLLEDIIEMLGFAEFDAQGASDGEEGILKARQWQPDVILCDIMMPGMDGFDVLRNIREMDDTSNIPFIFLTARGDRNSQRQGMALGADDFIVKPFTTNELLASISARLRRQADMTETSEARLEHTKQQLARMVTHELRTPLISINTVVEVISRQVNQLSPAEINELLESIDAGSKRLTHRVEQLVYVTQIEAGILSAVTIAEHGIPMHVWELQMAATNLARRFAYRQPANVEIKTQNRDPDATAMCNPAALKQAFAELLANALTFSPEDGIVHLSQWRTGGEIWISIADSGQGIPETQLANALRSFRQIERDKREQQGIGMGLTLAHQIISAHGGELTIRSIVGKGTQVIIKLPAYLAPL